MFWFSAGGISSVSSEMMWGALGVSTLVLVLVGRICNFVGPTPEVAQGTLLGFLLGYTPSEVAWGTSDVAVLHSSAVALV